MTLGDRIHYLRTEKGYTLQELGDMVGVGASTVRKRATSKRFALIKCRSSRNVGRLPDGVDR